MITVVKKNKLKYFMKQVVLYLWLFCKSSMILWKIKILISRLIINMGNSKKHTKKSRRLGKMKMIKMR